ncbi:hypothetical protein [Gimibacter soli]|uniref:Uncharacterized protein n=1 Tax=Gimibacter soli TaxID=3024400 RepID=A0AAE9XQ66_9PROT|nr:hypothetical protein [Gimibacter soli]WCL54217.1 hypothetical protein PH603_00400 [Gimibacter soli]
MSQHIFIERRQAKRNKPLLTGRTIFMLVLVSIAALAAFRLWIGNPEDALCEGACDQSHDLRILITGFFMMFAIIIAAGGVLGLIIGFLRRRHRSDGLDALIADAGKEIGSESDPRDPRA